MGRKKAKLPLREGTQLPPLTEEERLKRRTQGHPLDDFPLSPRMSQWREVSEQNALQSIGPERSITVPSERSTQELTDEKALTMSTAHESIKSVRHEIERSIERSIEQPENRHIKEAYIALDATHTASEAKVYGYLYRLSIVRGQSTCRASLAEMQDALGLAKNTIIKALRGLVDKLSIDVLERRPGSGIGSLYHVYSVKDIISRRKEAGIEIDELKRIVVKGSIERSTERSKIEPLNVQNLNVQLNVQSETKPLIEDTLAGPAGTTKNLLLRNDDDVSTSSSYADDDSSTITSIRRIYCDLTGNDWHDQDEKEASTIAQIDLGHIILGICYSLDRAAGHRVSSLKYCIPSILDHYDAMRSFPEKVLMEIAYTHMMRIKQAKKKNDWKATLGSPEG